MWQCRIAVMLFLIEPNHNIVRYVSIAELETYCEILFQTILVKLHAQIFVFRKNIMYDIIS